METMSKAHKYGKNDIETGTSNGQLYPNMIEDPKLRWAFIRKVYTILTVQLLCTVAVAAAVVFVRPIPNFLVSSWAGFGVYIAILIVPFILLWPLHHFKNKHPWNFILLALFTVAISCSVGVSCAFSKGRIVLESVILTTVVVISLTLYTFWAAKKERDFSFLGPILFCSLMVLIVFGIIQIWFPLGKVSHMIWGALGAIVFSGFIIFDTYNLIKRFSYDEYVVAAVSLYLDIINLFLAILGYSGSD
ncbi:hypothetical protein IFM89_013722 [Coptis chinensis]|uniref:BI1-like protein n=1 Tax=Coptis chinensis TaxID=261450 RepID=A0A835HVN5_9MAGN|nr:hypothetical protein IFM89_013722 [Coptis chinensis]